MFNIGGPEMIALVVLALLVFGPESLPDIAKTVSRTIRAFRQASMDLQTEVREALEIENSQRKGSTVITPARRLEDSADEVFGPAPRVSASKAPADPLATDLPPSPVESPPAEIETKSEPEIKAESQTEIKADGDPELEAQPQVDTAVEAEAEVEDDGDGPGVPMTRLVRVHEPELEPEMKPSLEIHS